MNILWLSWKDRTHPLAGGAETVSTEIRKHLLLDGHEVRLLTSRYPGSKSQEVVDGTEITRLGNRFSVYPRVFIYFRRHLKNWPDLIIDEMNTVPFGCAFYSRKQRVLVTYQLSRQVWLYQLPVPFSLIGYAIEPLYLKALSNKYPRIITISDSTRQELVKHGFKASSIRLFRVGINLKPVAKLPKKPTRTTVLSLGALRPMKRTLEIIKAFEVARDQNSKLKLVVAGDTSGKYAARVMKYAAASRHSKAISLKGRVPNRERIALMRAAGLIVVTSIKEGWGLIVTEANSQGTPAVVYDTDGLRDSVKHNVTGLLVPNSDYQKLGEAINDLLVDQATYDRLREQAWRWSQEFTLENSYQDFVKAL